MFQRLKTLKTLKGMSVKAFDVLVFRDGKWMPESSQKLVPGDLISLKVSKPQPGAVAKASSVVPAGQKSSAPPAPTVVNPAANIVPCDCVIVRGSAVVNEATLTGESIPQMKDALGHVKGKSSTSGASSSKEKDTISGISSNTLDMNGEHRVHTLFSGTSLVATSKAFLHQALALVHLTATCRRRRMVVVSAMFCGPASIHPRKACTSHRILYRKRLWRLEGDSAGIDAPALLRPRFFWCSAQKGT